MPSVRDLFSPSGLARLEAAVLPLVRNAGAYMQWVRRRLAADHIQEKQRNHLVTLADVEVERFLINGLRSIAPSSRFLGEETQHDPLTDAPTWIIDPIDGTTNYVQHIPFYCISVALAVDRRVVLGVVHDPVHDETFHASEAQPGAFLNHRPISVSTTSKIESAVITTGFPFSDFSLIETYSRILQELMRRTRALRRPGSAALDLVGVAAGRMDGFYEYGLSPWDVAAGAYLVRKAGGRVSDFQGGDDYLFGRQIAAGNPTVHRQLLEIIQRHLENPPH